MPDRKRLLQDTTTTTTRKPSWSIQPPLTDSELQREINYFTGPPLPQPQPQPQYNYFEPYRTTPQLNIPVNAEDYILANANNVSFSENFNKQKSIVHHEPSSSSLVLNHDPGIYLNSITDRQPVTKQYTPDYYPSQPDKFASMFLSSTNTAAAAAPSTTDHLPPPPPSMTQNKPSKLDSLLLSKHNQQHEQLSKKKQSSKKRKKKKPAVSSEDDDSSNDDDNEEPVIGDGALSYSSMGSNSSKTSLTKDDKRRRNTAASARFRIKKKMKEQALQNTACEMTDKAKMMEKRVHELESEIKWLKALVVEKNEARLKQLVRDRPSTSTAFPSFCNPVVEEEGEEEEEEEEEEYSFRY
ncbi:hypothetical protein BD770DRAFT_393614 [Pilaira anomala]|nr:hypothetical protein BD770DRAFT_393614 [Pilaira anomala]